MAAHSRAADVWITAEACMQPAF